MSSKIDERGVYKQFRGFTIVSSVVDIDDSWKNCHTFLTNQDSTTSHFSPLPYDSYHMTTTMLEDEVMVSRSSTEHHLDHEHKWEEHVNSRLPFYLSIVTALDSLDICPTFTVTNIDGMSQ
jgi:hypothetical protein